MTQIEEWASARKELVENLEFLIAKDLSGDDICKHLATNKATLTRRLFRMGRSDLVKLIGYPDRIYKKRIRVDNRRR